ncbi:TolC family protein [Zhongshania aquimaris]|uniref:TolC family protein n=1 Tax=Zhongshania aquimaris TaxID=2857107 RepID=A0ABS6VT30_9GAMM|nr:TolC family protein [Zhongshania aquimaris]MBW2941464.1 TolC family protein [Zhongshania aquimaris]
MSSSYRLGERARRLVPLCLIVFGLFNAPICAHATNRNISLATAITKTLAQNPQLHQYDLKQSGLASQLATQKLRPRVSASVEVENFAGSGDYASSKSAETTLALSSVMELGDKRSARVSLASTRLQLLEDERKIFTLDILGALTSNFIKAIKAQEMIAVAKEGLDLAKHTLTVVKKRAVQGAVADLEVKRAAAALAQAELRLSGLQQSHQRLVMKLASFWRETSPAWDGVDGSLYNFTSPPSYSDLYQRASRSPFITRYASDARLKKAELALAQTQSSTDISWQVGVRRFEETGDNALIAGISIPLFSDRRNASETNSARAAYDEVEYSKQYGLAKFHVQLYEAYSQYQQHAKSVRVYQQTIIPALVSILSDTEKAYQAGRYRYQDWIIAQEELLTAKRALIDNAAAASLNQAIIEQLIAEPL